MIVNKLIYEKQEVSLEEKNILIIGDSHPMRSLNPKYFHSAQNISQSAEPFVLTYWKLQKVFESFVPDTVILGFSPHNISEFNDFKFSDKTWSHEMFKRSYPIADFDGLGIEFDYVSYSKTLWKETAFYPKKNHNEFIGSYLSSRTNKITNWKKVVDRHFFKNGVELGVSETQVKYLHQMASLCEAKDVVLVIASHPLHKSYLDNIPSPVLNSYDGLIRQLEKNYIVIDKIAERYPDEYFLNVDHLNKFGADRFTKEVIDQLNQ